MYREYRDMPVINRTCMKATQDRAYQKHREALQKTKSTINTSAPAVPRTVGLNLKRYENEKQRNEEIAKENMRLLNDLEKIQNRKKSPNQSPQKHFTLRGQYHQEKAEQIDRENQKLVNALVNQRPNIKRTDFYYHNCDHIYQVNKMSIHKKTIPMSQIMRQKLPPMEDISPPKSNRTKPPRRIPQLDSNKAPSSSRDSLFVTNKGNSGQLQVPSKDSINQEGYKNDMKSKSDEMKDKYSGLLGKVYDDQEEEEEYNEEFVESEGSTSKEDEESDSKGKLEQITDEAAGNLIGGKDESDSKGKLDQIADDNLGILTGNKKEEQEKSDEKDDKSDDEDQDDENDDNEDDDVGQDDENDDNEDDDVGQDDENNDNESDDDDDQDNMDDDQDDDDENKDEDEESKESKGKLDQIADSNFGTLLGGENKDKDGDEDKNESKGKLEQITENHFGNFFGDKSKSTNNQSDDDDDNDDGNIDIDNSDDDDNDDDDDDDDTKDEENDDDED